MQERPRERYRHQIERALDRFPVVAIVGARQVGKTTLARQVARRWGEEVHFFDLEDPADLRSLADPGLTLRPLKGLVVLDEIQRLPEVFPLLRVLADRPGVPARFLVLGSASPELLRQGSESLAGRIAVVRLRGFSMDEVRERESSSLWIRGGFPRSLLARDDDESLHWRQEFLATYLERDLPQLAVRIPAPTLRRFWTMVAHAHGKSWNSSAMGRALGVSDTTTRRYLDALEATFMVRQLLPWHANVRKRQVKSPKVYVADTGLLHALLGLPDQRAVESHPICGFSWESFAMVQVIEHLGARPEECFFWATHAGAELDLLVVRGDRRVGYEFKRAEAPAVTKSMRIALADLALDRLFVVHAGPRSFPLADRLEAIALERLSTDTETR